MIARPAVLFVCLGNICRSPMAEGAMRAAAAGAGLTMDIGSAALENWYLGKPVDPRAEATARDHGVDISAHRARGVERADFTRFTHILALDRENLKALQQLAPGSATAQMALVMDMVPGREGRGIADPYFDDEGFGDTWRDVTMAAKALVTKFA
jgi:protein-tyrosine phosphatase